MLCLKLFKGHVLYIKMSIEYRIFPKDHLQS